MAFPDSLATSYVPSGTPVIKAADLNALQMETVRLWRGLRGADSLIEDEFTGPSLNTSLWSTPAFALTFTSDSPGALGTAIINPGITSSGSSPNSINTQALALASLDFRCMVGMRFPNYQPGGSTPIGAGDFFIIFTDAVTSAFGFRITRILNAPIFFNVQAIAAGPSFPDSLPSGGITAAPMHDTGIPVPGIAYGRFEIRRAGQSFTFLINDVVVYTFSFSGALPNVMFLIGTQAQLNGQIDYFKLYAIRQPVSSATLAQALGTHAESQKALFNGTQDFVDVTWMNPFADTNYRLPGPGVFVSSGTANITASFQNKTVNGIRVVPSARFTGEVYVEAHE
jgi:hypothetical protein